MEEKVSGEKLICELFFHKGYYVLEVKEVSNKPETKATRKIRELLKQGIREESKITSTAPLWNSPSEWIEFSKIGDYSDVQDCIYIWTGFRKDSEIVYLYVGIVGDTKRGGRSKRNLAQCLKEEQKKFQEEYGVSIERFRYCSLNNAQGYSVQELLKTVEMAEITVMTSLFKCENARDNIDALFDDYNVVLLNKMTSYKYIK